MFLFNKIVCQMHIYMYLTIKNFHSIFCGQLVLTGTDLSNKFSISWSETLANGRDAIVSFFFSSRRLLSVKYRKLRDWSK